MPFYKKKKLQCIGDILTFKKKKYIIFNVIFTDKNQYKTN